MKKMFLGLSFCLILFSGCAVSGYDDSLGVSEEVYDFYKDKLVNRFFVQGNGDGYSHPIEDTIDVAVDMHKEITKIFLIERESYNLPEDYITEIDIYALDVHHTSIILSLEDPERAINDFLNKAMESARYSFLFSRDSFDE